MCPNKEWFSSFKELHGEVLMGNNNACKTIRIGMIWLKTHVGEKALQNLGKQGLWFCEHCVFLENRVHHAK